MSMSTMSRSSAEHKSGEFKRGEEDRKQQAHLKKGSKASSQAKKRSELPSPDDGSSLVGGVTSLMGGALHKVSDMLPASVSQGATSLGNKAAGLSSSISGTASAVTSSVTSLPSNISSGVSSSLAGIRSGIDQRVESAGHTAAALKDKALHNDIMDAYEDHGVMAAAKTGLAVSSKAATKLKRQAMKSLSETTASLTGSAPQAPKKRGRRRRGGRRRGNRKLKTRLVDVPPAESVLDSMGEQAAAQIRRLDQPAGSGAAGKRGGVMESVRSGASGLMQSASAAASTLTNKIPGMSSLTGGGSQDSPQDRESESQRTRRLKQQAAEAHDKLDATIDDARRRAKRAADQSAGAVDGAKRAAADTLHAAKQSLPGQGQRSQSEQHPAFDGRPQITSLVTPRNPGDVLVPDQGPMIVSARPSSDLNDSAAAKAKFLATATKMDRSGKVPDQVAAGTVEKLLDGDQGEGGAGLLEQARGALETARAAIIERVEHLTGSEDEAQDPDQAKGDNKGDSNASIAKRAAKQAQDMKDKVAEKIDEQTGGAKAGNKRKQKARQ